MQSDFEFRIIETKQGFSMQHEITVPSSPKGSLRIRCSHKFQDKALLDRMKAALPASTEPKGDRQILFSEAHDLALSEADLHEYVSSSSTIFTGTVRELMVSHNSIKFSYEFWDDGNVYRDIGPSGYREIWQATDTRFADFLERFNVAGLPDLLLEVEGQRHLEIRTQLQSYAKENGLYTKVET